ncbi:MAG: type IX secretion system outer membrane channel protein PorV [Flavobacteriales bacterium]
MRILIISTFFVVFPRLILSQAESNDLQLNTITTALPFMAITPDSRAGGMGEAGTALSPSSTSVYWNTAGLSFAEKNSELSLSYTPWLRQLTNDMHLSYLSGYLRVNKKHAIGGALRFFSLGEITFTDASGNVLRNDKPSEFEITGAYAFKLSDKFSIGVNGKFAYSNLTGGLTVAGVMTKPGKVGAADLSMTYFNDRVKIGRNNATYTFATTINNIGNKVAYSVLAKRDFIPMNLKIGNALTLKYDSYNTITYALDIQRLLVPTPAFYDNINGQVTMLSGRSGDVGVINGMLQSFYDAPGVVAKDENGDYIQNNDGTYQIVKGSRFKEELSEINIAAGAEWWYNETFAIRSGVFYESRNKGNRQYLNLGASLKYNMFGIDFSYLASLNGRQNPLANTLRFTLRLYLGDKPVKSSDV